MKRHYYISHNLQDLGEVEQELESRGLTKPQFHVLSKDDAAVEMHHLNEVESVLRKDVVHSMEIGAVVGVVLAALVLLGAYYTGLVALAGWIPPVFLSIVVLGFCTWEGGLFGIQETHHQFKQFQQQLDSGDHIFFVDVNPAQEAALEDVVRKHPELQLAGVGTAVPAWFVGGQNRWRSFLETMP